MDTTTKTLKVWDSPVKMFCTQTSTQRQGEETVPGNRTGCHRDAYFYVEVGEVSEFYCMECAIQNGANPSMKEQVIGR